MASNNSLSDDDDWVLVDDDDFDVISLDSIDFGSDSGSDSDADSVSPNPDQDQDATHTEPQTARSEGLTQFFDAFTQQPPASDRPKDTLDHESKDAPVPATSDAKQCNPIGDQVEELNQLYEHTSIDSNVDPVLLQKAMVSLRDILHNTAQEIGATSLVGHGRTRSLGICSVLSSQVAVLGPITMKSCSSSSGTPQDFGLPPSLHKWATTVRSTVLGLKAEMLAMSSAKLPSSQANLETIFLNLENHWKEMDDLLPTIQTKYNKLQTNDTDRVAKSGARGETVNGSQPISIPQRDSGTPSSISHAECRERRRRKVIGWSLVRLRQRLAQMLYGLSRSKPGLSDSGLDCVRTHMNLQRTLYAATRTADFDWIDPGRLKHRGVDRAFIDELTKSLHAMMGVVSEDERILSGDHWLVHLRSLEGVAKVLDSALQEELESSI